MAKGQLRSNREAKKPKKVKAKEAAPVSLFTAGKRVAADIGNPRKK